MSVGCTLAYGARTRPYVGGNDYLLLIADAATKLAVTEDWLRRRPELPFVVKLSDGTVRYSAVGIDEFIAAHCGRGDQERRGTPRGNGPEGVLR